MTDTHSHPVLLFDGVCNLCNGFVQFVIKRDSKARFRFAALQSNSAQALLEQAGYANREDLDTVVLIENGKIYTHSDVALRVTGKLGGLWPLFSIFWVLPKFIRDAIYNWVARNRYRWFGKREACMIPTPELRERFID
ncbi:MAG: thiol-disulfide oxidoreductase DCC family protein [Saprospiraceae bacterium]|nr:thiol-disulfide oxidoreductase DCC family protein [Saprospiraceae bacterium]